MSQSPVSFPVLVFTCAIVCAATLTPALAQAPPPESMRVYQVALLRKGPNWSAEQTAEARELQAGHRKGMEEMAAAGKLVGAGPITADGDLRGVFIFAVGTVDEARTLAESDPAVKAGRYTTSVLEWYGPKGVGDDYFARIKADPSYAAKMQPYQFGFLRAVPGATTTPSRPEEELQREHLAHLSSMLRSGLVAAGPLSGSDDLRGILIFKLSSVEEAVRQASDDPKVKLGHLRVEMYPWLVADGVVPQMKPW